MESIIIQADSLTKKYGTATVLDNISLSISKSEIFGLIGPNGAGKSTFISIMATIIKPTSGSLIINGWNIRSHAAKIKPDIGFVPQEIALYPALSGLDNLRFWAGVYGLNGKLRDDRIDEALEIAGLPDRARDRVDRYSGGMKRRLNIAVALLHHPSILVLDEPMVGVDIQSRKYILDALKRLKDSGRTIVFASHYADEMKSLCDRLAVINNGKVMASGTFAALQRLTGRQDMEDVLFSIINEDLAVH